MSRSLVVLAAITASIVLINACTKATDPSDPVSGNKVSVAVSQFTDVPNLGGDVKSLALNASGSTVAIIDGKLHSTGAGGGQPNLLNSTTTHLALGLATTGEIYTISNTDFRTYGLDGTTPIVVPFSASGPLATNGRVEGGRFAFSPTGIPFVLVDNNYPRTYGYFTTDKGVTWQEMAFPGNFGAGPLRSLGDIAFNAQGHLFVGNASYFGGLFKSTDLGATWTKLTGTMPDYAARMLITPDNKIYTWVPRGGNLRVSNDGGASFNDLTQNNRSPFFVDVVRSSDGSFYAITTDIGLVRSTDGGTTWTQILAVQANDLDVWGNIVAVAGLETSTTAGGLRISTNGGQSWSQLGIRPMAAIQSFAFDKNQNLMLLGERSLYRRNGTIWQSLGSSTGFDYLATNPRGEILVGSFSSISYSSNDGATWLRTNEFPSYVYGGQGSIVLPVVLARRNGGFLISVTSYRYDLSQHVNGALYKVGTDGKPERIAGAPNPITRMVEDINGVLYASIELVDGFTGQFGGEIFKSIDGGNTWQKTGTGNSALIAFNSDNQVLAFGGETKFTLGTVGSTSPYAVTFTGFTGLPQSVTMARFDMQNKLYLLSSDMGLFISDFPVGLPSLPF